MTRYIRLNGKWVPCRILKSGARLITARRDDD